MFNIDLFSILNSVSLFDYENKEKKLGQVFTSRWVVELILNEVNYIDNIFNKKILEPSCGDGAFLSVIVERYIENALQNNIDLILIKKGLENNIFAIELDSYFYQECLKNLDKIANKYNIFNIKWNIFNTDSLNYYFKEKFDFVVGNPPYVRVHNLDLLTRNFLKNNYTFCNDGSTDLYYAFYEKAIKDININGKIAFITPNSFMRNGSGKVLRNYIINNNLLEKLINFGEYQVFDNVSVYNSIMILSSKNNDFDYYNFENEKLNFIDKIELKKFKNKIWNFSNNNDMIFINNIFTAEQNQENIKVQNGFATLGDKLYITDKIEKIDENYILFNGNKIEKNITKSIVKASRYDGTKIKSKIIFPYKNINDRWVVISNQEMQEIYPFCYEYFLKNKELFLKRDIDKNYTEWFQFGRSQSIQNVHQKKIVLSNIIKDKVRFFEAEKDVMVYSGLFIVANNLEYVKNKLISKEFIDYIRIVGKDMRGGYKNFNSGNVSRFLNVK